MSVREIDGRTIHQICSGQVVLSLAVAVKELVENSLDAGASNVEVRLREYGSELVEVIDNGCGVEPDNFEALALKHHTSKLRVFSDLPTVATFGFRGEALSSLCALSDLVVTTRHSAQPVGTRIEFDSNGRVRSKVSCARETGTSVALQNLFHTLPVRYKEFQRNLKKDYTKMIHMLQGYCLITTGVRISCYNQTGKGAKQLALSTSSNSAVKENILNIFGAKQLQQLVEVSQCSPADIPSEEEGVPPEALELFRLSGYVSRCNHGYGRSATDRQYYFFNKRPCDHPKLVKVVNEVYHVYNRHQFPFVVLNISTDRELVDVNLTPDKRKVLLHQERALLLLVKYSLTRLYEPMQREVDTRQQQQGVGSAPEARAGGSPMLRLGGLKRSYSFLTRDDSPHADSATVKPLKQPKIFDYGAELSGEKLTQSNAPPPQGATYRLPVSIRNTDQDVSIRSEARGAPHVCRGHSPLAGIEGEVASGGSPYDITSSPSDNCLRSSAEGAGTTINPNTDSATRENGHELTVRNSTTGVKGYSFQLFASGVADTAVSSSGGEGLGTGSTPCPHNEKPCPAEPKASRSRPLAVPHGDSCILQVDTKVPKDGHQMVRALTFDLQTTARRLETLQERASGPIASRHGRTFRAKIRPDCNETAEEELRREVSKEKLAKMEVIGQFNLGFIIGKLGNDLFIVDQHASDEKYNFERLQKTTVLQHQRLLQPKTLELTAVNEMVVMENLEIFRMNGFQFEVDCEGPPGRRVKLTSHPVSRNWTFDATDVEELIFLLSDSPGEVVRPSRIRQMFASRACRSSVMVGAALSKSEMKKLLLHMSEMEQPWNCPHGRPTLRHLVDLHLTMPD